MLDYLKKCENVQILTNYTPIEILGKNDKVTSLKIKSTIDNSIQEISASHIFIYIGSIPSTNFLDNLDILDEKKLVKVDNQMQTSIKGLYAIGDVNKNNNRQITTAIGDATIAALSAINYVNKIKSN